MTSHTGTKYEATRDLRTAEIAKLFRADVKTAIAAGELPAGLKLSVKTRAFAGGSSIDVVVTAMPAGALVLNPARVEADLRNQVTYGIVKIAHAIEQAERAAHEQLAAMGDVRAILGDAAQFGVLTAHAAGRDPRPARGARGPRRGVVNGRSHRAVNDRSRCRAATPPADASRYFLSGPTIAGDPAMTAATAEQTVRAIFAGSGFDDEGGLCFTSREGGNGTDCEPDPGTIRAARALCRRVEVGVPGARAAVETCDEWVTVSVTLPA